MASPIKNSDQGGKQKGQKYKSLLVWQYLLKNTDQNNAVSSTEIKNHLKKYGITADRHSIVRDIQAMQELLEKDADAKIEERERLRYEVIYDTKSHGYKVVSRPYTFEELRLLAECINSAKFLTNRQADDLKELIGEFCSDAQINELENEVYCVGRIKTKNKYIMGYMLEIHEAIGEKKKIKFKYLKYSLQSKGEQVERRKGADYILSPFRMVINDGNHYLLAFDSKKEKMLTFRVDRMKDVVKLDEPREGENVFADIDMNTYTQRVFSMFNGEQKRVRIRFTNDKLDTVVDRLGINNSTTYFADDPSHFIVSADIEISDQFYSWIAGFRKKATIISPVEVVEGMKKFLDDISGRYISE